MAIRRTVPLRRGVSCVVAALGVWLAVRAAHAQSCELFEPCIVEGSGTCQADGSCSGTPKPDNTVCDDHNECTLNDRCQGGRCVSGSPAETGTPCTSPLGACMTDPHCQFGFCFGDIKECPDIDGNKCTIDFCDPRSGECTSFANDCNDDCSTGQCDPTTGDCTNMQPRADGTSCDDFNSCTGNDRCQSGSCRGVVGPPTTPSTKTPTGQATATATEPAPSPTPTSTQVEAATPTATATTGVTPPASQCAGDCNNDGLVTIDELIKGVNIALGNAVVGDCLAFDLDASGTITVDELIKGVNAALTGCPAPLPTSTATTEPTATTTPSVTSTSMAPTQTPTIQVATATQALNTPTRTPSVAATLPPSATVTLATSTPTATGQPTATRTAAGSGTQTATRTATGGTVATETPGPPGETQTPTSTETPAVEATPTQGGSSLTQRVAGSIDSTTTAFLAIPDLLSALLRQPASLGDGAAAAAPIFSLPLPCSGGTGQLACAQDISQSPPFFGAPTYTVTLSDCKVTSQTGATLTFAGIVTATGVEGDVCGTIPSVLNVSTQNLSIKSATGAGSTTATFSNFNANVMLSCSAEQCDCNYDTVALQVSGTITVESKNAMGETLSSTQATFGNGSSISIAVAQYGAQCVPVIYTMIVDGNIVFTTDGNSFEALFAGYRLQDDATSGDDVITLSGSISSQCFGGEVQLASTTDLRVSTGSPCPKAGVVSVIAGDMTDAVRYTSNGGVEIDRGNDGTVDDVFQTCVDPHLLQCPGG